MPALDPAHAAPGGCRAPSPGRCPRRTPTCRPRRRPLSTDVEHRARARSRVQQRVERGRHDVGDRPRGSATRSASASSGRVSPVAVYTTASTSSASATRRVVGGGHAERTDAGELAGVAADLGRVRHDDPDQLEVAVRGHRPDRRPPRVARPPHHHPVRHRRRLRAPDAADPYSGIFSHHWHHQSGPTRMRSFGCQQYEISAVFSR